jgi:virginiamycin B lyase
MFASAVLASEIDSRDWKAHCRGIPQSVAVDADGRVFVVAMAANQILAYDPATAAVDRWRLGSGTLPRTLALASSGTIYFAAIGGAIGALDPSTRRVRLYAMQAPSTPYWVAAAPSGRIWFSDPGAMRLASLEPSSGALQDFPIPAVPYAITIDAHERIWVTLPEAGELGVLNPDTGMLRRIRLGPATRPRGIVASRGGIWIILEGTGTLVRLEGPRARDVTEYRPPPRFGPPVGLAMDRDGAVWVTFRDTQRRWRIGSRSGTPETVQSAAGSGEQGLYQESTGVRSCAVAGGV